MNRRALLSATTTLFALPGCAGLSSTSSTPTSGKPTTDSPGSSTPISTDEPSTTDEPPTPETTREVQQLTVGESAAIGEGSATLYRADAQRSIFVLDGSHHYDIVTEPDAQYLVVSMTTSDPVDGNRDARASTELLLDGERYPASEYYFPPASTGGFEVGYRVPLSTNGKDGRIVWTAESESEPFAEWTLSEETIAQLRQPPAFEVVSFEVPDTAESFEPFDVSITVENTGEGDGTFRAELGYGRASDLAPFRVDVSAGKRTTATDELQVSGTPGERDSIILDWGLDRSERTVEIVD